MQAKLPRWLLPVLLVALALVARLLPGARTIDDAYITFRYARNLLAGLGFVYNPGEAVLGTTTPLYTLLMAGLGALSGGADAPFPLLALGFNALADAGTCLLLWWLGRRLGSPLAGMGAGLLWVLAPYSVTFAIGGMETSLYVLLLTGLAAAWLARRRELAALCGVLALLTRPDAALLVVPLVAHRLYEAWRGDRLRRGEVLLFLLPGLAWGVFATLTFGSPVPQSVNAKLAVYRLGAGESLIRLIQHYATPFHWQNLLGAAGIGVGLALFPFLYALGAWRAWRAQPRLLMWLLYPLVYLLAFALPNPLIFRWYLTPPLPAYFLLILLGAEQLLRTLCQWRAWGAGLRVALTAGVVIGLPLAGLLSEWRLRLDHGPATPAPEMAFIKLELLYRQAAEQVTPQMQPGETLAAGDVGVLGYYTGARILDTVGLNSPRSLVYYPLPDEAYVINYAIPAELILQEQPDWLVALEVYGRNTFLRDTRFAERYQLVEMLPTDIYGSRGMGIWRRAPVP
ncbi:MAG: hypothetical protein HPY76_06980 [Anaerolineae bacterium]|nr:hypothetical protein [Anaerolineae bacterium]